MLDFSKVEFSEAKTESQIRTVAKLEITHEAVGRPDDGVNVNDLHQALRTFIFYKVYGELRGPVMEIAVLSSELPPDSRIRVLARELMGLLARPK